MIKFIRKIFISHPSEAGQTYLEHLMFSMCLSLRGFIIFVSGLVHSIFPFLCVRTASSYSYQNIEKIESQSNHHEKSVDVLSNQDEIRFIDLISQKNMIKKNVMNSLEKVVDSGAYIQGQPVRDLENKLAIYTQTEHVIACSSGTDALLLAMLALPLEPGDAVLMPSFGFVAAAEMALLLKLKPVFIDSDMTTFNIGLADIEKGYHDCKNSGLKPKAVVAINTFGLPCDYDSIGLFCKNHNLYLIEDCAQSFGAVYKGAKSGCLADISCTSFFPSKPLGCYGDGGAVFTNNNDFAKLMRCMQTHGQSAKKYHYDMTGINGRLDTLQAAILLEKLRVFDDEMVLRQKVASYYTNALRDILDTPFLPSDRTSAWAQYTLKHHNRDKLVHQLKKKNIPTAIHYPLPLQSQLPYQACMVSSDGCPNAQALCDLVFSIPMHPYLTTQQQDMVIEGIKEASL